MMTVQSGLVLTLPIVTMEQQEQLKNTFQCLFIYSLCTCVCHGLSMAIRGELLRVLFSLPTMWLQGN